MKTASLVHFYFGEDSYMRRLAQETVPLSLALEGYDRAVLLHHETDAGPFEVSAADEKHASVVDTPTFPNFTRQLVDLSDAGYEIDLYVFAHGTTGRFLTSKETYGDSIWASAAAIENTIQKPLNLRAVWQCNCYGASLNPTWQKIGAQVTMGTRYVDFYPTRFKGFAQAWAAGKPFGEALSESDTALVRTPVQSFMVVDAASRLQAWDGNLLQAATVLGTNDAASRYFSSCWLGKDYDDSKSGKQNMNYASSMRTVGDRTLTRA